MFNFDTKKIAQFIITIAIATIIMNLLAYIGTAVMIIMTSVAVAGSILIAILVVLSVVMMVKEIVNNHKHEA